MDGDGIVLNAVGAETVRHNRHWLAVCLLSENHHSKKFTAIERLYLPITAMSIFHADPQNDMDERLHAQKEKQVFQ
jgi:hypothetical protein